MKTSLLILALTVAKFAISQSNELKIYELDTKELITACKITAFVDNLDLASGYIESINGSVLTLRIAENTDYHIRVNETRTFELNASNDLAVGHTLVEVNEPQLVYRIQIGTFSEPIPTSFYVDINDISFEKKEGTEMTRIMTGNFYSFKEVKLVKNQIHNQGFADAFIVAYYNGERIEYAEALYMEQQNDQAKNSNLSSPENTSNRVEMASSNQKD